MVDPQTRSEIEALLSEHGLTPDKRYGQHFLADPNIVRRIVDFAEIEGWPVLEVGAGTGTLTVALARVASRVLAFEIDERYRTLLDRVVGGIENVEVRFADATNAPLANDLGGARWALVANLPYNIGTPLLLDLIQHAPQVTRFVVMVQREVADRLVADPGSRTYGLPSVTVSLHTRRTGMFHVPAQVFIPPPSVGSTVLRLERVEPPPGAARALDIAAQAFGMRRKMLRRSLAGIVDDVAFEAARVDPTNRPEEMSPLDFVRLAEVVE